MLTEHADAHHVCASTLHIPCPLKAKGTGSESMHKQHEVSGSTKHRGGTSCSEQHAYSCVEQRKGNKIRAKQNSSKCHEAMKMNRTH